MEEKRREEEEREGGAVIELKAASAPQLQHKHQHLFRVQLLGGPRRAIFQASSDRLTMSTAEVFHSRAESGMLTLQ